MAERSLCVIPQPKEVVWGDGAFALNAETWILLLPDAGAEEHRSAQSLQGEIAEATGLHLAIVKVAEPARLENVILLTGSATSARRYLGAGLPWGRALDGHGEQAYGVSITPERVIAGGRGAVAVHHAAQTLRQLARIERNTWPAVRIADWPSLAYRGLMLDVCRGKVPTVATLKALVDTLSLFKLNVLQLYTEHTFVFPHHPRIGVGCGSLSGEDMLELDAYARERHVELMPNLNSFGHCAHVLNMPEYVHLAESSTARWSLCPGDEVTYAFLDDLYGDMLPAFRSETFNVGCDETWDLGTGRSKEAVEAKGRGRVYLEHILRLRELAARHGRRIQVWGDILLHYPELVPELPEDVTLLDWHYEASDDYPSVRTFAESGREFWVCPGTSSWNTLFPRIENSNGNIRTLVRLGAEHGARGMLNTDWGDHGHYQPIGQCWYGYVYGGEQAWTGGTTADADFDDRFGPLLFGTSGQVVVSAMRDLARLNTLPGMARRNASSSIHALLDEPLVGPVAAQMPAETLGEIVRVCEAAIHALHNALAESRDPESVEEIVYSARMMAYAARKVQTTQAVRADLEGLAKGQGDARRTLQRAWETLRALDLELAELTEAFRAVWLRRAQQSEMEITLGHFAGVRGRYVAAQRWLEERLAALNAGQTPDYDLSAYTEDAANYEILGQAFWRQMREAGVSLG
ncbi:MAG: beta-N-acetylhexosaminidase [Chloroflexi bacterium]|nr:beta-N-acetylhexosaminidase [Chloroflexota bacterium]